MPPDADTRVADEVFHKALVSLCFPNMDSDRGRISFGWRKSLPLLHHPTPPSNAGAKFHVDRFAINVAA